MANTTEFLEALAWAPAHEQVSALASGETTAVALLEHVLSRIARDNPELNAVIALDLAGARAAAAEADAALARGERKPLLGVPVTVKENFNVAGLVTSVGNPAYRDNVAQSDAPAVAALREAGAIIIGKTNVPLSLADLQSYNAIYGVTRNPWSLAHTPGGSSGGSAVSIAAGFAALEIGTDIGGSIRVPAHFTGVYGHKPTVGLVYNGGTGVPSGRETLRDLTVAGPLARSAYDLEVALKVLLNRDPLASKAWRAELPAARHEKLSNFKVLLLTQWPGEAQSNSERLVHERLAGVLEQAGVTVYHPDDLGDVLPDLPAAHLIYRSLLGASLPAPAKRPELGPEVSASEVAWKLAPFLTHNEWLALHEQRLQLRKQWESVFTRIDLVLSPVLSTTAFRLDDSEPKDARRFPVHYGDEIKPLRFADFFNWAGLPVLPGLPATSFPLGLDKEGLPIGAQAVGPYLEDLTAIRFAELFSERVGGFQRPPARGSAAAGGR